jgi:hypothetical protein
MPSRAAGDHGVVASQSGQLWAEVRFGISVSVPPQSLAGNSTIARSP